VAGGQGGEGTGVALARSPVFSRCLRILLLVPRRYDSTYQPSPDGEIPPSVFVALHRLLARKYGGLSLPSRSYQPPLVEGLWSEGGRDYPPELLHSIDVVTRHLETDAELGAEEEWMLTVLYPRVKQDFGQQQIFLLIQMAQRAIES
jgi:hypothetical protein